MFRMSACIFDISLLQCWAVSLVNEGMYTYALERLGIGPQLSMVYAAFFSNIVCYTPCKTRIKQKFLNRFDIIIIICASIVHSCTRNSASDCQQVLSWKCLYKDPEAQRVCCLLSLLGFFDRFGPFVSKQCPL